MRSAAIAVFIVAVGMGPVVAKGGPPAVKPGGGHAVKAGPAAGSRAPKTTTRTVKATPTPQGGKSVRVKGAAPKPASPGKSVRPKTQTKVRATGKTTAPGGGKQMKATKGAPAATAKTPHQKSKAAPGVTAGGEVVTGPNVPKNPKLQARLQAMLPDGMPLAEAAAGFKNQGQFVAALHVSENHGIPFTELKLRMVDEGMSLGQAIQDVKPTLNGVTEAQFAERQATADLR